MVFSTDSPVGQDIRDSKQVSDATKVITDAVVGAWLDFPAAVTGFASLGLEQFAYSLGFIAGGKQGLQLHLNRPTLS